jgi:hypothetical protein
MKALADAADFPWKTDGYREPQDDFIDGIVFDGRNPNDYLSKFAIGMKADERVRICSEPLAPILRAATIAACLATPVAAQSLAERGGLFRVDRRGGGHRSSKTPIPRCPARA